LTAQWHPQANMSQVSGNELVFARGEGAYLFDEAGRKYFDAPASLWYCNIGHGRPEIAEAAAAQLRTLESYSNFENLSTRPTLDLAERVTAMSPIGEAKIFFTSGGSDAIDTAAKLARRYWSALGRPGKTGIVSRDLAYHGLHAYGTSITGLDANREGLGPLVPDTYRVATNDSSDLEALLADKADTVAAFFCEPVMGTGGVIPPAPGYLERVQQLCASHDVLFVADEVITGFGRTGKMFATELFGLDPDLIVIAKGITSGYLPLGGVIASRRVWEPFYAPGTDLVFRHGITYSGHATACAAAMANLDIIERENLVERVAGLSPVLHELARGLGSHELVTEVRTGVGLLAGIQMRDPGIAKRVAAVCRDEGVLVRVITHGTLQLSPPFVAEEPELRHAAEVIGQAISTVSSQVESVG
jgi:putrescine---pyruvate transaminase